MWCGRMKKSESEFEETAKASRKLVCDQASKQHIELNAIVLLGPTNHLAPLVYQRRHLASSVTCAGQEKEGTEVTSSYARCFPLK